MELEVVRDVVDKVLDCDAEVMVCDRDCVALVWVIVVNVVMVLEEVIVRELLVLEVAVEVDVSVALVRDV